MLQLQRNMRPPPAKRRISDTDKRRKYPFEKMTKVGDFFFVPNKRRESIRTYFGTIGRRLSIRLRSEQIYARLVDGKWEPCEEDARGATSGVGVWRTK